MRRQNQQELWLMLKQKNRNLKWICLAAVTLLCAAMPICYGQIEANDLTSPKEKNSLDGPDNPMELLFRMMGGLLIVIALMMTVFYLSKRVLPKLNRNSGKEIQILETTMLGPRKYLHVIKVANQRLLLGSTNDRINMLAHLVNDLAHLDIELHEEKEGS
jgi:flagellar biosynthetic protein FliO